MEATVKAHRGQVMRKMPARSSAEPVRIAYANGKWVKNHPHPVVEVVASNAKAAAELVCGVMLRNKGHLHEYRAQVWPVGGVRHAHEISHFYSV